MIASAEDAPAGSVPDGEREIPEDVLGARVTPDAVGVKNQARVVFGVRLPGTARLERADEVGPAVHPRVGGDPDSSVEAVGLRLRRRVARGLEPGVTETDRAVGPDALAIRAADRQSLGHASQESAIDGRVVPMDDADDAAHREGAASAAGSSA